MDRLFLDASILFSAAWGSPVAERLWVLGRVQASVRLLTSGYALAEARRNLEAHGHRARLEALIAGVELVPEAPLYSILPPSVLLAAKDRPILAAAAAARATHLLTGDREHFAALFGSEVLGVRVMTIRQYFQSRSIE